MGEPLPIHREMHDAIDGARSRTRLVDLSAAVWRAHHAGGLGADEAQAFAELIHVRTTLLKAEAPATGFFRPISLFPPRRLQRPRQRGAAIARRRQLAASGPLPPALAARFTTGENAVLKIVSDEVFATGRCALDLAQIAARAGVCRSLAQQTLRRAARMDLVAIEERRRKGAKNLTNVVTVVDRDWLAWLYRGARLRRREAIGSKKVAPTGKQVSEKEGFVTLERPSHISGGPFRGFG